MRRRRRRALAPTGRAVRRRWSRHACGTCSCRHSAFGTAAFSKTTQALHNAQKSALQNKLLNILQDCILGVQLSRRVELKSLPAPLNDKLCDIFINNSIWPCFQLWIDVNDVFPALFDDDSKFIGIKKQFTKLFLAY